jgi:Pyruvate/2-oxoacid:ferredoxin oxidoreductase delta subunit
MGSFLTCDIPPFQQNPNGKLLRAAAFMVTAVDNPADSSAEDTNVPAISSAEATGKDDDVPKPEEKDAPEDKIIISTPSKCLTVYDPVDLGFNDDIRGWYGDERRGWYDVSGCGVCNDYCRVVGDLQQIISSYFSCKLAGSNKEYNSVTDSTSPWSEPLWDDWNNYYYVKFGFPKCSGKGVAPPKTCFVKADPVDLGFNDDRQGWYDVSGCGVCNDYCRNVGTPAWFSCKLAGTFREYTNQDYADWGTPGMFKFTKCSGKGVATPQTCVVAADPVDPGWDDEKRGWYDVSGCGVCNDYCRNVGELGSVWFSCKLAGTFAEYTDDYKDWGTPGNVFDFPTCSGKGATPPSKIMTGEFQA